MRLGTITNQASSASAVPPPPVSPPSALADPSLVAVVAAIRQAIPHQERAARRLGCLLYVAPDLISFEASPDDAEIFARDVTQTDADGTRRVYRRLSPAYYVWLRERIIDAKARLSPERYAILAIRAVPIRDAAKRHFNQVQLAEMISLGTRGRYEFPRPAGYGQVVLDIGNAPMPISKECREWCDRISGKKRRSTKAKA